jgi:lipoprotein-releasing system ATP-binding protein
VSAREVDSPAASPAPDGRRVVLDARKVVRELGAVGTRVLDDVDLLVREGEFVALTGASGSGKSTLLYLLGVLDRPTSGQIVVDGVDVTGLDDDERAELRSAKLGFVFQFHFLLPEFTVLENVLIPMLRSRKRRPAAAERHAREVLERLGLGALVERRPSQLSGGQQQRVSIARAVANDPHILLADEPTGNLDSKNGEIVMDVFEGLVADTGLTIIMVTHEREFAARATRQVELRDGRVLHDSADPTSGFELHQGG